MWISTEVVRWESNPNNVRFGVFSHPSVNSAWALSKTQPAIFASAAKMARKCRMLPTTKPVIVCVLHTSQFSFFTLSLFLLLLLRVLTPAAVTFRRSLGDCQAVPQLLSLLLQGLEALAGPRTDRCKNRQVQEQTATRIFTFKTRHIPNEEITNIVNCCPTAVTRVTLTRC